jgi:two-component system nitrogen regulation response regulator NtrX
MPSTVFIVDDEKNIRRTLSMVLEGEGFTVEEAASGEEALLRLPDLAPEILLLDVQLPGISGHDVLEQLDKLFPAGEARPSVIMISGHGTLADAVRATKAGAYDFIEKPLDRERLMVTLRNAVERRVMAAEVADLRALTEGRWEMVGRSAAMSALFAQIAKVAPTRTRVLITRETGTGNELVARAIHRESPLRNKPFVKVNCAAIPPELIESELFGHERGAFTGAVARKKGLFELADGGTIFLDEIGDMGLSAQAKVLRVLQSGEFNRVGAETTLKADVRVVAATNRDLQAGVAKGQFREDLYFRLNVVPLRAPPLRDRAEDIPLLSQTFVGQICRENGMKDKPVSAEVLALLSAYPWPGNVRELRNVIERLCILSDESIGTGDLPEEIIAEANRRQRPPSTSAAASLARVELPPEARSLPLREFRDLMERQYIRAKLEETGWNISRTAIVLGIERTNLHKKMRSLGLSRDDREGGERDGDDDPRDDGAPDQG